MVDIERRTFLGVCGAAAISPWMALQETRRQAAWCGVDLASSGDKTAVMWIGHGASIDFDDPDNWFPVRKLKIGDVVIFGGA